MNHLQRQLVSVRCRYPDRKRISVDACVLAVYCPAEYALDQVRAGVPAGTHLRSSVDWWTFERSAADSQCSVIALPCLMELRLQSLISGFRVRRPFGGLVLITSATFGNARVLNHFRVDEVVWLHEVRRELWPSVLRASTLPHFQWIARLVESAGHLPLTLRQALGFACRHPAIPLSVSDLATAFHCDRRTLWRMWHQSFDSPPPLRLEDLLGWLVLLRATALKTAQRGWTSVAVELGVHEHTLGRLAQRLTGQTLRALKAEGQLSVWSLFQRRVLSMLLRTETTWDFSRHSAVDL